MKKQSKTTQGKTIQEVECTHAEQNTSACESEYTDTLDMPCEMEIGFVSEFFKVLGDSTRFKILMLLRKRELCVHTIVKCLGAEQSVVSHHLKTLRNVHLVATRREGKHIYYRLNDKHIEEILDTALIHIREK